jgi:hypothetical protein
MQANEIRLNVADIIVSLAIEPAVRISGHVESFLSDEPAEATVNIRFNGETNQAAEDRRQQVLARHLGWNAYSTVDGKSLLVERLSGRIQVRFAADRRRCNTVDVLLRRPEEPGTLAGTSPEQELSLVLVEVLPLPAVVLLSGRQGLFLHSCAVSLEQGGALFSGVSGAGKSTMAELWRRFAPSNSHVIDDEHILARLNGETAWLYGAPWSRGPRAATYSRTPLKAVFFISHAVQNSCIRMSHSEALAELMSQVFLPVWSREQLELTTQTCADLLARADCYRLPFVPNREVIGFVQDILQHSN